MILSDEDARTIQLVSSGFLTCGLAMAVLVPAVFPSIRSVKSVSERNSVFWSPRGFLGAKGRSPIFGIAWFLIYSSQLYLAVALLIVSLQNSILPDPIGLLNGSACIFAATMLSSLWTPLFTLAKPWAFTASSTLLILCAVFATVGVVACKPLFHGVIWLDIGLAMLSIFSGWVITAAAISIGITTKAYSRGVDSIEQDEASLAPIIVSILLFVLGVVFANPVLPATLLVATLFMPIQMRSIWISTVICAAGVGAGVVMVYVYRNTGLFW